MMIKILIDTDVVLDFFFNREPFSEYASKIISLCESGNINGYITPVICSNVYYLLRQNAVHKRVIEKMSQLLLIIEVLVMDKDVVLQSLSSGFKDFEDALQNYAATRSGFIDMIVTRNVKDYSKSEIAVFTPESFLKTRDITF